MSWQQQVSVCHFGAHRVGEEVGKKGVVNKVSFIGSGRRLYSGGGDRGQVVELWGWALNNIFGQQGVGW